MSFMKFSKSVGNFPHHIYAGPPQQVPPFNILNSIAPTDVQLIQNVCSHCSVNVLLMSNVIISAYWV